MNSSLVSILIPTFNRPHYLQIALESALKQTYPNMEIIIGDDSTNDKTERLIHEQYLPNYSNIKYIRNSTTLGQFHNDLMLLKHSGGEYINFLMDDDLFYSNKIERMMTYFQQDLNKKLALVTSYRNWIDDHGNPTESNASIKELYKEDTIVNGKDFGNRMLISGQNIIGEPTTVLFRKELLTESFGTLNGRNYNCSVDMASWIALLSKGDAMYIASPLSSFRFHTGQQVHHKLLEGSEDFLHLVLTAKEYGFLQDEVDYRTSLLKAYEWCIGSLEFYKQYPNLIPDAHVRLSHCLNIIIKKLNTQ
ncbi:glycosyltransferase family 2 protein [Bacillus mycoides]|uniref:glycosyltransferase family 2 protein n=1 Tax=Bacillus TaxID=1386 RepID=UPI000DC42BC7|nr:MULTISPECIES: glycosyltransferase family 2 protein [Bacillus]MBJ7957777.1 glycosyltransferase family 2 protein [Bacillus cereus group sp. N28]MDI6531565.1 glycosyltransferase family 2 protein [Bacillus mycoides]MED1056298.1 glycosyltransferase family 2 protein [Bacillus mycoides]RAN71506.1 glycosyl transferase family 2 [Bacillus sp. SRB_8]WJE59598.1 glycosyltransferase family 2 protein [Bacillus mycoides]